MLELVITCLIVWSILTKTGLELWFRIMAATLFAVKYLIIFGLIIGVICTPQMYKLIGWTPASILWGDHLYDKSLPVSVQRSNNGNP